MEQPLYVNQKASEIPHILHPEQDIQKSPTLDITAVNKMIQPVPSQTLEQVATPSQEPKLHLRKGVMRPDDSVKRTLHNKVKAIMMAGVVGLSGAMATDDTHAGDFSKSAEKVFGALAIGAINANTPGAPFVLKQNPNGGDPVLVLKGPGQRPVNQYFEPGVVEYARSMGVEIISDKDIFTILNFKNQNDEKKSFQKYYDPTHFTTAIELKKAPGEGMYLKINFVQNSVAQVQSLFITIGQDGKMVFR